METQNCLQFNLSSYLSLSYIRLNRVTGPRSYKSNKVWISMIPDLPDPSATI